MGEGGLGGIEGRMEVRALRWAGEKTRMQERVLRREMGEDVGVELVERREGDGEFVIFPYFCLRV
jgi:hypothetical protein